jgi:hypothetical protein
MTFLITILLLMAILITLNMGDITYNDILLTNDFTYNSK